MKKNNLQVTTVQVGKPQSVLQSLMANLNTGRNKEHNEGLPSVIYDNLGELIKSPQDAERITAIIKTGEFEVVKAIQVFNNPLKLYQDRKLKPENFRDASKSNLPTLAAIKKYKGETAAVVVARNIIKNFVSKFNVTGVMPPEQIDELAWEFLDNYYYLNLAEFKFLFRKAQRQTTYNRMDFNTVLVILDEYITKRTKGMADDSFYNHKDRTGDESAHRQKPTAKDDFIRSQSVAEIVAAKAEFAKSK